MGDPIFRLEGVIKTKSEMEDFEGPLSLILQLLSKNKIEIKDIVIADILEQYLEYLDRMADMDLEIASEFVTMASHLVYIKTRMLLRGDDEEVSELDQLISSLEDLKRRDILSRLREIIPRFSEMHTRGIGYIAKPPEYLPPDTTYRYSHEKEDLRTAMFRVFSREEAVAASKEHRPVAYPSRIPYAVSSKLTEIVDRLRRFGVMRVSALFYESRSRSELVATFISVLELCKLGSVRLAGAEDDLTITYTGTGGEVSVSEFDNGAEQNGNS